MMFRHNGQPVIPCKQKDTWPDMIYYIRWRTNHRVSIISLYNTTGHVRVVFLPIATYRSLIVWHNKVMHDINLVYYLLKSERTRIVLSLYYLLINKNKRPTYLDGNLSTIVKEPKVSTYDKKKNSGFWRGMVTISVENYLSDFWNYNASIRHF